MTEAEIQSLIQLKASEEGHRLWRTNAGSIQTKHGGVVKMMPKGYPDLTGFRYSDGKFVVIEVKKPGGRLSKQQKNFLKWAITKPIIYGVARSWTEALEIIENGGMSEQRWKELEQTDGVELPFDEIKVDF